MHDNYDYYYDEQVYKNGKDCVGRNKGGIGRMIVTMIGVLVMVGCPPLGAIIIYTGAKHGGW